MLTARYGPYTHKTLGYRYFVEKYADGSRKTVYEHRERAARKLGRALRPDEQVHHRNEVKTDNRGRNLEVMLIGQHSKKHARPKTMVKLKCGTCGAAFERRKGNDPAAKKYAKAFCSRPCFWESKKKPS